MEPDDLLCSRNARPPKALVGRAQWKINQPPSLKRQRASWEGSFISFDARNRGSTRLPFRESVKNHCGLAGELFEQPARSNFSASLILHSPLALVFVIAV
jgi:hypothetical protein